MTRPAVLGMLAMLPLGCLLEFDPQLLEQDSVPRLAASAVHTCALDGDDVPWCWGDNASGELGRSEPGNEPAPIEDLQLRTLAADGPSTAHVCGIDSDEGSVLCWGTNGDAELGNGMIGGGGPDPSRAELESPAVRISAGITVSVAIDERGRMWTWGWNGGQRLGLGAEVDSVTTPRLLDDMRVWVALGYGARHGCAIDEDGGLLCWGEAEHGKLGRTDIDAAPAAIDGGASGWRSVACGDDHSCAVARDGSLWCWGSNASGQLGVRGAEGPSVRRVGDAHDWIAVAAGAVHACGLRGEGSLWCWGSNASGQLGVGTTVDHDTPTQAGERHDWLEVMVAGEHSCGRTRDEVTWCWGSNSHGQIGAPDTAAVPAPRIVLGR
jgi:alpha-tubulin suppressor-like RCC1 family protein